MSIISVKDELPTPLMLGNESGEVLMWLRMENKWCLGFYDYNNDVWQFAERGRAVNERYDTVTHWQPLPGRPQ